MSNRNYDSSIITSQYSNKIASKTLYTRMTNGVSIIGNSINGNYNNSNISNVLNGASKNIENAYSTSNVESKQQCNACN